jgi:hypothetical protein
MSKMRFVYNDGGRAASGYKGDAGDCVVRAIAIATQMPYREIYDRVNSVAKERPKHRLIRSRGKIRYQARSSARNGVLKPDIRKIMAQLGWTWTPTMRIGSGCKVHLLASELPPGRLVVQVSKHLTAVIDGVIHDTHDPQRGPVAYMKGSESGRAVLDHISPERCVYGYYSKEQSQ